MKLSDEDRRRLKAIFRASGILHRYSVLEDYGRTGDFSFFSKIADAEIFPSTEDRMKVFRSQATTLSIAAVKDMLSLNPSIDLAHITHLVVVSCTGMYAPGLDIDIIRHLNLRTTVQRTAINFMGCYAAFNAIKVADAFCCNDASAKVLIVCTELCSLHFQPAPTPDNLLANALFSDGAAAVMVEAVSTSRLQLKPESFHTDISEEHAQDMAWTIGDFGFEMKLSSYVPDIIRGGIAQLTRTLLEKISRKFADIHFFAIHPGGKKILEAIEQELGITRQQNEMSHYILQQYGNMSSATVLFVLKSVAATFTSNDAGKRILSFAFGPGLTLESMVLKIEHA